MFNDEKLWSIFHKVSFNLDALENVVEPCAPRMSKGYNLFDSMLTEDLWNIAINRGIFGIYNPVYVYEVCLQHIKGKEKLLLDDGHMNIFFVFGKNYKFFYQSFFKEKGKWYAKMSPVGNKPGTEVQVVGSRIFF